MARILPREGGLAGERDLRAININPCAGLIAPGAIDLVGKRSGGKQQAKQHRIFQHEKTSMAGHGGYA
jgi:hypothetical protein